jgi:hypothetical protein
LFVNGIEFLSQVAKPMGRAALATLEIEIACREEDW